MSSKNTGLITMHDAMTPRQEAVAEMRKRGETLEVIARELNISLTTVWKDLTRVREIWKERQAAHYDVLVAEACARYDWALSKLAPKIDAGSIAALEAFIRLEDRRARLLGIDKPVETKVTISIEAVAARIAELKGKADLPVLEGEIVEETA